MTVRQHLEAHRAAGPLVTAAGVRTFVREEGDVDAPAVLCLHGVPVSSYLYRKVLPALAERGCRGIAWDLPGLGFADRPRVHDYSWSGLARWSHALVDHLGLDDVHLVLHDIGGPIGLLLAEQPGDRVRSITLLNTIVDPVSFRPPLVMKPFTVPLRGDLGRAFLRIMRSFEHDERTGARMRAGLHAAPPGGVGRARPGPARGDPRRARPVRGRRRHDPAAAGQALPPGGLPGGGGRRGRTTGARPRLTTRRVRTRAVRWAPAAGIGGIVVRTAALSRTGTRRVVHPGSHAAAATAPTIFRRPQHGANRSLP